MTKIVAAFSFGIMLLLFYCECRSNYESQFNPSSNREVDSYKVKEWQRYLDYHRKLMKDTLSNIRKSKKKKKIPKSKSKNKIIAPKFVLSRTQEGFVVKQHEDGLDSTGSGRFEFPKQPALMTNVKYRFDGSVSPVIKLSETDKGVVIKRLEYGFAQNPGVKWQGRSGLSKKLKSNNINEKGVVNINAGVNQRFPEGAISLRGTLRMLNNTEGLAADQLSGIEPLALDENYEVETEQFMQMEGDDSFEKEDIYYTYDNYDENSEITPDDENWDNYSLSGEDNRKIRK